MVQFPGRRTWHAVTKPGKEEPLSTHLAGAQAWEIYYQRLGCKTRLVETQASRGPAYREPARPLAGSGPTLF